MPRRFSLLSFPDVKKRAAQIAAITRNGYMPPWLPEHGYGDFANDRSLTPAQIETIAAWVRAGAPEGSASNVPVPPAFPTEWQLGKPDLVLEAKNPADLPPSGPDLYWNVIFTPNLTVRR